MAEGKREEADHEPSALGVANLGASRRIANRQRNSSFIVVRVVIGKQIVLMAAAVTLWNPPVLVTSVGFFLMYTQRLNSPRDAVVPITPRDLPCPRRLHPP